MRAKRPRISTSPRRMMKAEVCIIALYEGVAIS
jgi:hypothetical protein